MKEKDFIRVLFYKGFDKRFFKPENYGEQPASLGAIKLSNKEFFQAVKGTDLSGNMPDVCFADSSNSTKHCKIELEKKDIPYLNIQMHGFNLRLSVDNEQPINLSFFSGDEYTLSASRDSEDSIAYTYGMVDWRDKVQFGDRIYSGFLIFKKVSTAAQSSLRLDSVVFRPGIVVSIDKKRAPICQLQSPKVINFIDDSITARRANAIPSLIDQMFSAIPPFAACTADNIAE